jgi:hypothetical protein
VAEAEKHHVDDAGTSAFHRLISRRDLFLGAASAAAAVPPLLALPIVVAHASSPQTAVTKAEFQSLVGTDFHFALRTGRTVACRLESVTDLPIPPQSPDPAPGGEAFSLLFGRTQRLGFGQGSYIITHRKVDAFTLFVVPVGAPSAAHRCEAVVNRLWS